jgi:hypothetical protein
MRNAFYEVCGVHPLGPQKKKRRNYGRVTKLDYNKEIAKNMAAG